MEKAANISQLTNFKQLSDESSSFGDDYVFAHITHKNRFQHKAQPYRVDGFTWILCLGGELDVSVNLNQCHMTPSTLLVAAPNSILSVSNITWENLDSYLLFMSGEFMHNVNIDLNALHNNTVVLPLSRPPLMNISQEDATMMQRYFELIHHNTCKNDDVYVRSISRCLVSALLYQVLQISHRSSEPYGEQNTLHSRRTMYVRRFMQLVHTHHLDERNVGFYAEQLYISPKYLSLIVKEVTGRSAAEWIDDFVILEAKNRLKFSGRNVQQVAYDLHFPNQSAFGKYFKHLTGMSPSKYQHS
ncbi:MAG: AraC family transcriptional regulator [Muribaculaceae bacterium]|nr:AraC family transcriptional regulator [Muribaculaceae bacterium]